MSRFLGVDTSNYTTSVAIYDTALAEPVSRRQLLPVAEGRLGLRQSDAVFHHVRQLPQLIAQLPGGQSFDAIGFSATPRTEQGSYMPCFLAGQAVAQSLGHVLGVPQYAFSHQQGHIMAGVYSAKAEHLLAAPFLAIHISGGTTDGLLVTPNDAGLDIQLVGGSLDLKAGQLVDRVGLMLGLSFPAGPQLEALALQSEVTVFPNLRPSVKALGCNLSGGYNLCQQQFAKTGSAPQTARYCLEFLSVSLSALVKALRGQYGHLPCLFVGGVAANTILRANLMGAHDALSFASASLSGDNAVGVALLAARRHQACGLVESSR